MVDLVGVHSLSVRLVALGAGNRRDLVKQELRAEPPGVSATPGLPACCRCRPPALGSGRRAWGPGDGSVSQSHPRAGGGASPAQSGTVGLRTE